MDLDRHAIEPAGLLEHHRDRQRLFPARARRAPDPDRAARLAGQLRHDALGDRVNLIDLAPEVGFGHRQRVQHLPPAIVAAALVVLQQIVQIEERSEPPLDHQRRHALGEQVAASVAEEQAGAFVHELEQHRQPGRRNAERLGCGTSCAARPRSRRHRAAAPLRRRAGPPRTDRSARSRQTIEPIRACPARRGSRPRLAEPPGRRPRARRECRLTRSGATAGPAPQSPRGARADRARTGSRRPRGWPLPTLAPSPRWRRRAAKDHRRLPPARRSPAVPPACGRCRSCAAPPSPRGRRRAGHRPRRSSGATRPRGSLPQRASASAAAVRRSASGALSASAQRFEHQRRVHRAERTHRGIRHHRIVRLGQPAEDGGDTLAADGADRIDRGDADVLHPVVPCERVEQRHGEGIGLASEARRREIPDPCVGIAQGAAERGERLAAVDVAPARARPPRAPAACPRPRAAMSVGTTRSSSRKAMCSSAAARTVSSGS